MNSEMKTFSLMPVAHHRASRVGPFQITIFPKPAGTIRVAFAAKLLK
jgi:hypothetical protein